jgi:hypothetical protein
MARLDKDHRLLKQGLAGGSGVEFERAIGIFLAFLGYAPVWWGPDMGKKLPRPGDLQPGAAPDTLAYREAQRDLLIVESTVGVVGSDKITKLVGRSLRVRSALRDELGRRAPSVRAILATSLKHDELGDTAREALQQNGAGLLARADIDELMTMLSAGATKAEVGQRFEAIFPNGGYALSRW